MSSTGRFRFFSTCVDWPTVDVHKPGGLRDLINERRTIARRTFLQHVDRDELQRIAADLDYSAHPAQGLTMAADFHVEYFRSRWHGNTVYGFVWSAIEYVWTVG